MPGPLVDPLRASIHVEPLRLSTTCSLDCLPPTPCDGTVLLDVDDVVVPWVFGAVPPLVAVGSVAGCVGGKRSARTTRHETATMAARAIITMFDSRRWRRRWRGCDRGRDAIDGCSAAPRGSWWRELNSSTYGWPSRPRYSA